MKASKGKEKNRQSGDMETSRFSIRGKTKPAEPPPQSAQDKDAVYSVVSHMERTLFIVDLSKLEAEGDTLVGSLVMYRPLYEFKKVLIVCISVVNKAQSQMPHQVGVLQCTR